MLSWYKLCTRGQRQINIDPALHRNYYLQVCSTERFLFVPLRKHSSEVFISTSLISPWVSVWLDGVCSDWTAGDCVVCCPCPPPPKPSAARACREDSPELPFWEPAKHRQGSIDVTTLPLYTHPALQGCNSPHPNPTRHLRASHEATAELTDTWLPHTTTISKNKVQKKLIDTNPIVFHIQPTFIWPCATNGKYCGGSGYPQH